MVEAMPLLQCNRCGHLKIAKMKHPSDMPPYSCFFFLLFISFWVTGVQSFSLVQTSKSPLVLVKDNTEIFCTLRNQNMDQIGVYWYRQTAKTADELEFVVFSSILNKVRYGSLFSERVSVARENFRNTFTLKIKNVEFTDSGVYYCMVENAGKVAFGNGTSLQVVETLPTTAAPKTKTKKKPCKCKKSQTPSPVICSAVIWAPLAGFALILIIVLGATVSYTKRIYRRTRQFYRKQ
ncbi:T-cell surface glycoprotein CD8 beta chain-like [Xenopus laevis]|uniref:T-cell surface glycoprotein CD8 beta chain-like n=1 Tax=Xenopus laevis TaxID=8355 RepID=A0A8J1LVH3_XENLA|nr:T-cell surface glycoprotein CD8 beta chain-like [Xenopus laevis]